jgi:hypothetical protein
MTLNPLCIAHCLVANWLAAGLLPLTQRSPAPTLYRIGHFLELETSRSRNRTIGPMRDCLTAARKVACELIAKPAIGCRSFSKPSKLTAASVELPALNFRSAYSVSELNGRETFPVLKCYARCLFADVGSEIANTLAIGDPRRR